MLYVTFVIIAAIAAGVVVVSNVRKKKIHAQVREAMEKEVVMPEGFEGFTSQLSQKLGIEGVVASGVVIGDLVYHYSKIDSTVLEAVKWRAAGDPSSFSEIKDYMSSSLDSASIEGLTNNWQGVTGELVAMDILQSQGHTVVLADNPSQAGWDMMVDGTLYQVKTSGAGAVIEHIDRYPDIPVIAAEQAGAVGGDVMVLDGLDANEIRENVVDTFEGVDGFGSWLPGIPFITLGISSFRNASKLSKGILTNGEAVKYIFQDTVGVGLGSWGGASLGAAVGGAFLGPFGAVALGIIGGVVGAFTGKSIATSGRRKRFKELERLFDNLCTRFKCDFVSSRQRMIDAFSCRAKETGDAARQVYQPESLFKKLRNWFWPSENVYVAEYVHERSQSEINAITANIDSFINSIAKVEPKPAFPMIFKRFELVEAAGLSEKAQEVIATAVELRIECEKIR